MPYFKGNFYHNFIKELIKYESNIDSLKLEAVLG